MPFESEFVLGMGGDEPRLVPWYAFITDARLEIFSEDVGPGEWVVGMTQLLRVSWQTPRMWVNGVEILGNLTTAQPWFTRLSNPGTISVGVEKADSGVLMLVRV